MSEHIESGGDEFLNLKARIANETMASASPGDRAVIEAVSEVEHKCVQLLRHRIQDRSDIEELKRQMAPLTSLYQKLSSGYALFCFVAIALYAAYEAFQKLQGTFR